LAVSFPFHTTTGFQALDLVFFGAVKTLSARVVGAFGDELGKDHIIQIVQAYEQTAMSMEIHGSFHKSGLTPDTSSRPLKLKGDKDRLCENKGFKERFGSGRWRWKSRDCRGGDKLIDSE
jgi:hypothetical protein